VRVVPPNFLKANLTNAKLDETRYFIVCDAHDPSMDYMSSLHTTGEGEVTLGIGAMDEEAFQNAPDLDLEAFQKRLRASFYDAKLDGAALPPYLSEFFKQRTPSCADYMWVFRRVDTNTNPDLDCTDLDCTRKGN
jgi:hypothetical protein